MSLADVADLLACPVCSGPLTLDDRTLRCERRHSFDLAKQGYVNLLAGPQPANADTAAMIAARGRFLEAGHYAPIAAAVAQAVGGAQACVEAGAGTGYYLARAVGPDARGLALDVSVAAAKVAARLPGRIGSVVADTWRGLPVRDAAVDAVLAVFAPKNASEFARVLRPGGLLVTVTPTPRHLAEARETLGLLGIQEQKAERLDQTLAASFDARGRTRVEFPLDLDATACRDLVEMGPNAFHAHAAPQAQRVTVSVDVAAYAKPA